MSDGSIVLSKQDAIRRYVRALNVKARAGSATKLPISEIVIRERIIPEDSKVIAQLVVSMRKIGQTTPILTRRGPDGKPILIDGLNRIAALKQLGEVEVLAIGLDMNSDLDAKACEAFSNSHRRQKLTALDRALIDVVQVQYVAQKVSQDAVPRGGWQPKEKYHAKTARELGVSSDQIARSCKIAKIVPFVQNAIRKYGLEDNQSLLIEVASSGDDQSAQFHTFTRILPRYEKAPKKGSPRCGSNNPAHAGNNTSQEQAPVRSHSQELDGDGAEEPEVAQVRGASTRKQESAAEAASASTTETISSKRGASHFERARRLWMQASELRATIREFDGHDRQRFMDECVRPELFGTPAGLVS